MSKRILSLLLALVLLVGLMPVGALPVHAADASEKEAAYFKVKAGDKELTLEAKGDDVVFEEPYEGCDTHGFYPVEDEKAWGYTVRYPAGTTSVTINMEDMSNQADLWKSDKTHFQCGVDGKLENVPVLTDASDFYVLYNGNDDRYYALYFQVECKHLSRSTKYVSNGDGTHNVVSYCTDCGTELSSDVQSCVDKNKDGMCDRCKAVIGAAAPTVTVTGFADKNMVIRYDVGAAATAFTASATSPDGGDLTYQWYVNTAEDYDGATPIEGQTGAAFTPDTSAETEMKFFFCRVTNTNEHGTATADSPLQPVIVGEVPTVTVYFSLSDDDHYVMGDNDGGGSGEVQALKKVTVPYFDLGLYDLDGFYFKSESYGPVDPDHPGMGSVLTPGTSAYAYGKITDLHLMIYMLETQYVGYGPEEAGKGLLYEEGYMGTSAFSISGSTGSFFMQEVWGHDLNLNYYHNYVYPLASGGWGSTMDQILCHENDVFTMMMFSDWSFFQDSGAGFNHFGTKDNKVPAELEVLPNKTLELTLYRSYGFGGDYSTDHTVVTDQLPVYYTDLEEIPDGDVTTWTSCGSTDENGLFTVDPQALDLKVGHQYLFAVAGQHGIDYPDAIVSAPGGVIVDVVKTLTDPGDEMSVYVTMNGSDGVSNFGKLDFEEISTYDKICTNVSSALDVISEATGYTFELDKNGIVSITDPNGVKIANGQYGPNSKWTMLVNGDNPADYADDGVFTNCAVWDGDEFTFTYTADRKEMPISVTVDGSSFESQFQDLKATFQGTTYSGQTAADALTKVLDDNGYTYAGSTSYVSGITDSNGVALTAGDAAHGPWSGWMFTINGEMPIQGVDPESGYTIYATLDTYVLQEGDVLRMYFVNCPTDSGDHSWDEGKVTKEPTCKDEGEMTYTCTVCGATRTEPIAKLTTHSWDEGKVTKEPTCKDEGEMTYTCTVCGATRTEPIAKLTTHSWDEGKVTKEPTLDAEGEMTYTCMVCGITRTEPIAKLTACDGKDNCPSHKFTDVNTSKWYHEAVDFAVVNGLFAGTSDTTFDPDGAMTRAMLVTVLWRMAGRPEPAAKASFRDVAESSYYAKAVAWAKENGIVAGTSETTFSPNDNVTREQMAAILYRYGRKFDAIGGQESSDLSSFPDSAQVSSYAKEALSWAVRQGVISGSLEGGKTYLDPQGNATRAQVASVLMRFSQLKR